MLWLRETSAQRCFLAETQIVTAGQENVAQNVQVFLKSIAGAGGTETTFVKKKKKKISMCSDLSRFTSEAIFQTCSCLVPCDWSR